MPDRQEPIDITPPAGYAGYFIYPPENGEGLLNFQINTLSGEPGRWKLRLIPEDDVAAYSYVSSSGEGTGECGQALDILEIQIPSEANGGSAYAEISADFVTCNPEDPGRMVAFSNFSLQWVSLGPPLEATPTLTPTPGGCSISMSGSPTYISPGSSSTITLQALDGNGQPLPGKNVDYYISRGPGSLIGGSPVTGSTGRLSFDYNAPGDVGGATRATITATVEGCEVMGSVTVFFGPSPTPEHTATVTMTVQAPVTPTATPPATDTPQAAEQAVPYNIWVDRIVPLQSIENADLAANKAMGVRVFVKWDGFGPSPPLTVRLSLDGREVGSLPFVIRPAYSEAEIRFARNSPNFNVDRSWLDAGSHDLLATVKQSSGQPDADPSDDTDSLNIYLNPSSPIRVLFNLSVSNQTMTRSDAVRFSREAKVFFEDTYPIPYMVRRIGVVASGRFLDNRWTAAIATCRYRKIHNAKNPNQYVDFAVGLFPTGHYGSGNLGFSFPVCRRGVLVDIDEYPSLTHEIGHYYLGGKEEYVDGGPRGIVINNLSRYRSHSRQFDYIRPQDGVINFMGVVTPVDWVNPQTSNRILSLLRPLQGHQVHGGLASFVDDLITSPGASQEAGPGYLISGLINRQDEVTLDPIYFLDHADMEAEPAGEYSVVAYSAQGEVEAEVPFAAYEEGFDAEAPGYPFLVTVPASASVSKFEIKRGDQVIHVVTRSQAPPQVESVSHPREASPSEPFELSWQALDPDGDALSYSLFYSCDADSGWELIANDIVESNLTVDPSSLPGGERCSFEVVANDGMNTASAISEHPISVQDKPPQVNILPDRDNWTLPEGEIIWLEGAGFDFEDGELSESFLQWQDATGELIGSGHALTLADLEPGDHRIAFTGWDSAQQFSRDEITITILPTKQGEEGLDLLGSDMMMGLLIVSGCGWVLVLGSIVLLSLLSKGQTWAKLLIVVLVFLLVVFTVGAGYAGFMLYREGAGAKPTDGAQIAGGPRSASPAEATEALSETAAPTEPPTSTPEPSATPTRTTTVEPSPTASTTPQFPPANWRVDLIDPGLHVGEFPSLGLDARGRPHVSYSYYTEESGDPDYDLRYAHFDGSAWQIEVVDGQGGEVVGWFTSLTLDQDGDPHISYHDAYRGDLKYARHKDGTWKVFRLDQDGKVGFFTSLAVDSESWVYISYWDVDNKDLKFLLGNESLDSDPWMYVALEEEGEIGEHTSMALDSYGMPHLTCYDRTYGALFYAFFDGEGWTATLVESEGNVGLDSSLALDAEDRPHIAYYDLANEDLRYAYFDGDEWRVSVVDSEGAVGRSPSIALDSEGRPHISYYKMGSNELRYAALIGGEWKIGVVDLVGSVGGQERTSLALDASGRPHVVYYSTEGLKYAVAAED
jgi:hypothetical protein